MSKLMKKNNRQKYLLIVLIMVALTLVSVAGCTKRVTFNIKADEELNKDFNEPHTLVLLIFQLRNEKDFDASWEEYLNSNYDHSKVLGDPIRKVIVPGSAFEITLQREKEAKFIGVITGYYKPKVPLRVKQVVNLSEGSHVTLKLGPYGIVEVKQ